MDAEQNSEEVGNLELNLCWIPRIIFMRSKCAPVGLVVARQPQYNQKAQRTVNLDIKLPCINKQLPALPGLHQP